jgi:hypothetical protein
MGGPQVSQASQGLIQLVQRCCRLRIDGHLLSGCLDFAPDMHQFGEVVSTEPREKAPGLADESLLRRGVGKALLPKLLTLFDCHVQATSDDEVDTEQIQRNVGCIRLSPSCLL